MRPLRVLLVESDEAAAERLLGLLRSGGLGLSVESVTELAPALSHLSRGGTDVVILSLDLPDSQGLGTFERMCAFAPDVPVVVVTREEDEELALASVQGGAQDFLVHTQVTPAVLSRALRYAVERHRLLSAL
ncbi:MAG TPA: response regulator, partial [Longimicrobiales bacterium]|nr:response regulator [Longimicrobiales bacterium]